MAPPTTKLKDAIDWARSLMLFSARPEHLDTLIKAAEYKGKELWVEVTCTRYSTVSVVEWEAIVRRDLAQALARKIVEEKWPSVRMEHLPHQASIRYRMRTVLSIGHEA